LEDIEVRENPQHRVPIFYVLAVVDMEHAGNGRRKTTARNIIQLTAISEGRKF
jgi:hypothetical protein